ncbi:HGL011Cp [Eremothecium sinecaudum]|uniref:HGL011Cp n=1 Tax=Eremothecium sinecaudum TaxID=45286 RepID=A0A0X8HVR9_9SACH|nr:HGL011Cp [Eremothecium sinecaudum]AMD22329.1 HGL011Cp [Eremothecium sinecaudum]
MVSPVFVSRRPESLNYRNLIRGVKIAVYGCIKSIQTLEGKQRWVALKLGAYSIVLYAILNFLQTWIRELSVLCDLGMVIVGVVECAMQSELDYMFWASLHAETSNEHINPENIAKSRRNGRDRLQAPVALMQGILRKAALMILISPLPTKWAVILLYCWSFSQLQYRFGSEFAAVISTAMCLYSLKTSFFWSINLVNHVWTLELCIRMILSPYFKDAKFNRGEQELWITSRSGVLYGFGLVIYVFIMKYPWLSGLLFYISHSSAAVLISAITEPQPANLPLNGKEMSRWVSRQLLWGL